MDPSVPKFTRTIEVNDVAATIGYAKRPSKAESKPQAPVASVSAAAVRDFLLQAAEAPNWSPAYLQKTLSVDAQTARGVLTALSATGYIEPDPEDSRNWRNTAAGNAMAGVSKARPIKRATAEKAVAEFIDRVREVNLEPGYLYRVERAVVFGPYLRQDINIKNVDIAVDLRPKIADKKALEGKVKADADRAESEGKHFKSSADRRAWGINRVRQYLKGNGRSLALYDLDESKLAQPHELIYSS